MTDINKYGLSRHVPADVAREVRIRDGFGCVHCGSMLPLEYEHFDPEFKDAREHLAKGIVLLWNVVTAKRARFFPKLQ